MRTYVGERCHVSGRGRVWVVERDVDPGSQSMHQLLAGMELAGRRILLGERGRRALASPPGAVLDWGVEGDPAELAHAILRAELAVEPTQVVSERFGVTLVRALATAGFALTAEDVWRWIAANRQLVERELFLRPADDDLALSVIDEPRDTADLPQEPTASALVAACEDAWRQIQHHHPEVPDAVVVLGSGVERGRLVKLGHWWGGRWLADGQLRGEVLIAGEALHLEPAQVFEVLLHEAAHGVNAARGVKDTSRGGRYHNQRYAATAREMLLRVRSMAPYGMASTSLTPEAAARYEHAIEHLGNAMRIARQLERAVGVSTGNEADGGPAGGRERSSGRSVGAACGCGRRLRIAPSVLSAGPVVCGLCGEEFSLPQSAERSPEDRVASPVVDQSFLARRQRALAGVAGADSPEPDLARVGRHRARLAAIVAEATGPNGIGRDLLSERLHRLEKLAGQQNPIASASTDQRRGLAKLAEELIGEADAGALREWYERFGTPDEQPMPAASAIDADRRTRLARALLRADGTLQGPEVEEPIQLAAGDRVTAIADVPHGPPLGALGTVERVHVTEQEVEIDFATSGRLATRLGADVATFLRHDYAEVRQPSELDPRIELDRSTPEVGL